VRRGPCWLWIDSRVRGSAFERPSELDAPEAVLGAVANAHGPWEVEVLLKTSMERPGAGTAYVGRPGRGGGRSADACPFVVKCPPELGEALGRHAAEIARLAERTGEKATS
jgi:hypothetical protein